jgi:hypothetical protein
MPVDATAEHLGIPLKTDGFPLQHTVGVRYWQLQHEEYLGAPVPMGVGVNWAPGLNTGACGKKHRNVADWKNNCTCGLYCYRWAKDIQTTSYFNMQTGVPNVGADAGVVGGIAYWIPRQPNATPGVQIVSARYAAVGALTIPQGASKAHQKRIVEMAMRYGVEIVKPTEIGDAVDKWVAEKLPSFYELPPRPLFELLGKTKRYVPQNQWSVQVDDRARPYFGN